MKTKTKLAVALVALSLAACAPQGAQGATGGAVDVSRVYRWVRHACSALEAAGGAVGLDRPAAVPAAGGER